MSWFSRRRAALACRDAVALVTDYLEGALSRPDRARLERHLADCPHCSTYLEQIRTTIAALGRVEPESLSREAQEDLVALFRRYQAG
ncbi:MAG TPA: zf-HC2 domain-containing protein [Mycobacteriales bacterium]|nr:zf-HC2 domain-containing protein [Mycobacteriales bacterium]